MKTFYDRVFRLAVWRARWLAPLALAGLLAFSIVCGAIGVNFGEHWDEHYQIEGVQECVDGLVLAPRKYIYGNVYFLLGNAVVLADDPGFPLAFLREMRAREDYTMVEIDQYNSVRRFRFLAREFLNSPRYLLEMRMVFFCLSALGAVWIYLAIRMLRPGRPLAALAGAAFVVLSWELHYHSRFIAVDALMAQLAALEMYLLAAAWSTRAAGSFAFNYVAAAAVAGISFACKATGLALLIPVLVLPFVRRPPPGQRRHAVPLAGLAGIVFFMTVVVLQPGTLYDFPRYATTLRREAWEYGLKTSPAPHTTASVVDRTSKFLQWLWLAVPSPYRVGAALLSAVTLVGVVRFVRNRFRLALVGGSLVALMVVTMAMHPLLIVRQYLLLIPLEALAFGIGVAVLQFHLAQRPGLRRGLLLAMGLVFALNARWLYRTARTIPGADMPGTLDHLTADLLARPQRIRLSPLVHAAIADRLKGYRCQAGDTKDEPERDAPLAIRADERRWHANELGMTARTYGARWVNFDWYTPWVSNPASPPIFVLPLEYARKQRIQVEAYSVCTPEPDPGRR